MNRRAFRIILLATGLVTFAVSVLITPFLTVHMASVRGYLAIGGEAFLPVAGALAFYGLYHLGEHICKKSPKRY